MSLVRIARFRINSTRAVFWKQNFLKGHLPHILFPHFLASLVPVGDRSGGEIEVKVVNFGAT